MSDDKEPFLARWSRLKQERLADEQSANPAAPPPEEADARVGAAAQLPPPEDLTPQSDFSAFMSSKVADTLRRAALKKLFAHPDINVADPFEPFSGDWTISKAIPEEMLARLQQARAALRQEPGAQAEPSAADAEANDPPPEEQQARSDSVPGRQDA
jgi:Protein of unknown function (DUF3306)